VHLQAPLAALPGELERVGMQLAEDGSTLEYTFDSTREGEGIPALLARISALGITYRDLNTQQSSLEDIFVSLVRERA
jgi:ABC-2 type transport system ATP-binding protein